MLGALGAIANGESRAKEVEAMYRLASDKFEEMAATREYLTSATNGDFQDIGETRFIWSAEVQPTGIENLDALVVTVERESRNSPIQASASGLIYNAPIDTGGGTTGGTP